MADEWPLTRSELARRYGVYPSAVARAMDRAREAHDQDPTVALPPQPVDPGQLIWRYLPAEFDPWWANRPTRGRPPKRGV